MPTWGQILAELGGVQPPGSLDTTRRRYLRSLSDLTGRAAILYSSAWLESRPSLPGDVQVGMPDLQGFMEAVSNIQERELDLILHSPGGSAEAAESIVEYLRQRFDHIRVFIPVAAMSAATMIALSADEIVMGQHSQLGPTDPQFIISTPEGPRSSPAQAILNQFNLAKQECRTPENLAAWVPILRTYAPGLLTQCLDSQRLASEMVAGWLKRFMFANDTDAEQKTQTIAEWFADYESFHSHGRRVGRNQAREVGLKVNVLEGDDGLQDAVLSVHHAAMHTFSRTPATKIIENHHGRAYVRMSTSIQVQTAPQQQQQQPQPQIQPPQPNRAERRRQGRNQ